MNTLFTIVLTILFLATCTFTFAQVPIQLANYAKKQQRKSADKKEDLVQADFDLAGGLILVDADINGSTGQFVFDTGAPHLFLNSKNRKGKDSKHTIVGVGGHQTLKVNKNIKVNWSGQEIKNRNTYGLDLSHIEKAKGKEIAGLLGYETVKGKELFIDYKAQKLYLVSNKNKSFFAGHENVDRVFFKLEGHIPVIRVRFGKKNFYFGIDTGAEVNVIDEKLKGKIPKELIEEMASTKIVGIQVDKEESNFIKVKSTRVGKSTYQDLEYVFVDLSGFRAGNGYQLDGFLGYSFLKQANFSINYRKNQLIRWEPIGPSKDVKLVRKDATNEWNQ